MRGENEELAAKIDRIHGSSPHARGKRGFQFSIIDPLGLIPACAGKTSKTDTERNAQWAHPRMRGENMWCAPAIRTPTGSSPHARGKLELEEKQLRADRLIPACAGKTARSWIICCLTRAHPRMRGENRRRRGAMLVREGSSPHARGKPIQEFQARNRVRLIPACAGKTNSFNTMPSVDRGSSPHARGKPISTFTANEEPGLIPACAGKTSWLQPMSRCRWAHPRMRGENGAHQSQERCLWGSSPHARGKPERAVLKKFSEGLIPACAGKTVGQESHATQARAHPRMRGENYGVPYIVQPTGGSSPHARGKPLACAI